MITDKAKYYSSGSTYPPLAFGNCGYISWDDDVDYSKTEYVDGNTYTFSIPSYYQLLNDDMQIPANKKVKITLI